LSCDPQRVRGVRKADRQWRCDKTLEQLAELDFAKALGFLINGLKREQLIALNSMIYISSSFDGFG
jgi:Fe-Mn family superoxide dismutase